MKKKIEKGDTGTMGHSCPGAVGTCKKETRSIKLTRLANEASKIDAEIRYYESRIFDVLDQIKDMKPTKQEINKRGDLQDLLDCY